MSGADARPFDGVVFDMDGLLVDSETVALAAIRTAGVELGVEIPACLRQQMIGVPADTCRRLVVDKYGDPGFADKLFELAGKHHAAEVQAGKLRLKSGASELLDLLDQAGIPRAVATSSSRAKAELHLRATGILDRFDAIVTRDDVDRGKPFPDLFVAAAARLGLSPERCLALEDSHNGVRAAHAAGMPVVMIPDLLQPTAEMHDKCHAVAEGLHAIAALLHIDARS